MSVEQIQSHLQKVSNKKLEDYRDNLALQFKLITPDKRSSTTLAAIGNMGGQDEMLKWNVKTFFAVYEKVDAQGSDAMRGDEYEMADAWGAWRFIYHLLTSFIDGLPEDAVAQRATFEAMSVPQALINCICLASSRVHRPLRVKDALIKDAEYVGINCRRDEGFREEDSDEYLISDVFPNGYLEQDLLRLFSDRTLKHITRAGEETTVTVSGSNLTVT
jgi:hypothetical protein